VCCRARDRPDTLQNPSHELRKLTCRVQGFHLILDPTSSRGLSWVRDSSAEWDSANSKKTVPGAVSTLEIGDASRKTAADGPLTTRVRTTERYDREMKLSKVSFDKHFETTIGASGVGARRPRLDGPLGGRRGAREHPR
jgi:hypothetical protein